MTDRTEATERTEATIAAELTERTEATIAAELREVERYLTDAPPHSGAGARESLLARRDRLQRELAASRDEGEPGRRSAVP